MEINIPLYVQFVIDRLEEKGYEAYIVGGCIRDILLEKIPNDFDVVTNALPEEIEEVFKDKKTIDVGKQFGTIIIHLDNASVEVTTFRTEGEYVDGRRPKWLKFVSTIEEDLSRRDFTINSIAYNKYKGLVDPFGGMEDIHKKLIRCVGNPYERFMEDYLRILRAVRFSTVLDFKIEEETFLACKKYGEKISQVSMERINQEFVKILMSDKPSIGLEVMRKIGIFEIVLPELIPTIGFDQKNPHHEKDVYNHILCVVDNTPSILKVRLAALFHDAGKPYTFSVDEEGVGHFYGHDKVGAEIAKKALERLKFPKKMIEDVFILIENHMTHHGTFKDKGLKRLIRRVGKENIDDLFLLQKSDRICSNKDASIESILDMENKVKEILSRNEAYEIKHLAINGEDLLKMGYIEGPEIGEMLEYLLEKVMEKPEFNETDKLKELVLKKYPIDAKI
ncbi:MAG: HDIG domain protein [Sporanaerobacter sp.]|uniref:CCA tRNA nucleotidyltransferase n=1 Tax=Sporanaerobacter sp. TaxID=2010183 RepID=UPI003A0FEC9B